MAELPQPSPESISPEELARDVFIHEVSSRCVTEENRLFTFYSNFVGDDYVIPESFSDALVTAYSKSIKSALRFPTPYALFFDTPSKVYDAISPGDYMHLLEFMGQDSVNPLTSKLRAQVAIASREGIVPPYPERQFEPFMQMIKNAESMAYQRGVSKGKMYADEALYKELVKETVPLVSYIAGIQQIHDAYTLENALEINARQIHLNMRIDTDPELFLATGIQYDEDEVKDLAISLLEEKGIVRETVKQIDKARTIAVGYGNNQLQRIYGTTADVF